jgi:PDZ domain
MSKKFLSAMIFGASALSVGGLVYADEPQEKEKKEFKVRAVVVNDDDEPATVHLTHVNKLWLGVGLKSIEGDLSDFLGSDDGILVEDVHDDSPASKAGIVKGDILLSINETELGGPADLLEFMKTAKDGQALKLKLRRKDEEKVVEVTPTVRPKGLSAAINLKELGDENFQFHYEPADPADPAVLKMFRMGDPSGIFVPQGLPAGDFQFNFSSNQNGKSVEVKITRKGDKPAEITVTRDGETKTYTEDKLDEVPEDIRGWIGSMVKPGSRSIVGLGELSNLSKHVQGFKIDAGSLNEHLEALMKDSKLPEEAHKALRQALEGAAAGADRAKAAAEAFNNPELRKQLDEIRKRASAEVSEAAAKAAVQAKKAMIEAEKHARGASRAAKSENKEVEELRQLVDELKKEVAELRAANKKDKNE